MSKPKHRKRRDEEQRLGKHRTTKHQLPAQQSGIADARSNRVASDKFKRWLTRPSVGHTKIPDKKQGDYDIRLALDQIAIGLAAAHRWHAIAKRRWQMIAKPPVELLLRAASQTRTAFSRRYASLESLLKAKRHISRSVVTRTTRTYVYEVRPRSNERRVDLISDALPFGPLRYTGPNAVSDAIEFAKFFSCSQHHAVIVVYDEGGNVIEAQLARGRFQRAVSAIIFGIPWRTKTRPRW